MGKKDKGRELKNMDNIEYQQKMGASVTFSGEDVTQNTGINPTNTEVYRYYRILSNYFYNRFKWTSPQIAKNELDLIEYYLFNYGFCALLKPKLANNNVLIKTNEYKIFPCVITRYNLRSFEPEQINVVNSTTKNLVTTYNKCEFEIITNEFMLDSIVPFSTFAWEYANKLHEIDLVFNMNSIKLRMPIVFNNAKVNSKNVPFVSKIAEYIRSAIGRNEPYVDIPEDYVGENGFLHESNNIVNDLSQHMQTQKKVYDSYFELLGLYAIKEKTGVYEVKELQEDGDETGNFKSRVYTNNRMKCLKNIVSNFNIDMTLEEIR